MSSTHSGFIGRAPGRTHRDDNPVNAGEVEVMGQAKARRQELHTARSAEMINPPGMVRIFDADTIRKRPVKARGQN